MAPAVMVGAREVADDVAFADGACATASDEPGSNALGVELVAAWQAHDLADTINVLFQANNTFFLTTTVATTPLRKSGIALFFFGSGRTPLKR